MTALITQTTTTQAPCGQDCVYLDGTCYCYHGETVPSEFGDPVLDSLTPPF